MRTDTVPSLAIQREDGLWFAGLSSAGAFRWTRDADPRYRLPTERIAERAAAELQRAGHAVRVVFVP